MLRGFGVEAGASVAVEAVTGIVKIDFDFWMSGLDRFNFFVRNMRILLAEMEHDWDSWSFT